MTISSKISQTYFRFIFFTLAILFTNYPANALNVTSGVFIQTVDEEAFLSSSSLVVRHFLDSEESIQYSIKEFNELPFPETPPTTNQFTYIVNSPDFVSPAERDIQPSSFIYEPNDITGTASAISTPDPDDTEVRGIGLGGVMKWGLPNDQYLVGGDWLIDYDVSRIEKNKELIDEEKTTTEISGWYLTNYFHFPALIYDVIDEALISGSDSFYLSGGLGWSPEFATGFGANLPGDQLYTVTSSFVLCAQDDDALAANPVKQIPCVFPNITINGKTGTNKVDSANQATLTVDLGLATNEAYPNADYFAAYVHEGQLFWLNKNLEWTTTAGPAYQGPLMELRSFKIPTPSVDLPSGASLPIYFGVDATPNGKFDEPQRFTSVTMTIN